MALLTVQTLSRAGIVPTYAAAAGGGDAFPNDGATFVHIKNGGGGPITATFVTPATEEGEPIADRAVVVGAGAEAMIGPFPSAVFNDASGQVAITYSGVTSVTVGAFKVPKA